MRGAALPTTQDAILSTPNQRSRVSLTVFLRHKTSSRQAFRWTTTGPASTPIPLHRSKLEPLNSVCGSKSSVQHVDPCLRREVFLRQQGITHEVLETCDCSFHLLKINFNHIERHGKARMRLRRTPQHKCCESEDLKTALVDNHTMISMTQKPQLKLTLDKLRWEPKPDWCQIESTLLFWSTRPARALHHYSLFTDERMEFNRRSLNLGPPNPSTPSDLSSSKTKRLRAE